MVDVGPTAAQLTEQAHALREEATHLLHDGGLLALIGALGPVALRGSYALDVMTWRDLDVAVQLPHARAIGAFFEVGRAIATHLETAQMRYSDWALRPDGPYDSGLYWGMRLWWHAHVWKVDLWGFGPDGFARDEAASEGVRRLVERADRVTVLRIKDAVCHRPEYRDTLTSLDVYTAVAEHAIHTVEAFDAWWRQRREEPRAP
jgi:hypothetical protein